MTGPVRNIFKGIPVELPEELIEIISGNAAVRIERIVSRGHTSPDDFWYDQDQNEFVVLLKGRGGLVFENRSGIVVLRPGDFIDIPKHVRHRVEWTAAGEDTVWLAVFY